MQVEQMKSLLRNHVKAIVEGYQVLDDLSPNAAFQEFGFYLDPSQKRTIDGAPHFRVIFPDATTVGGWAKSYSDPIETHFSDDKSVKQQSAVPLVHKICPAKTIVRGGEGPTDGKLQETLTDIRDLKDDPLVKKAELGVKAVKREFDPEYKMAKRHIHAEKTMAHNLLGKTKHDYLSTKHGMKAQQFGLKNQAYGMKVTEDYGAPEAGLHDFTKASETQNYIKNVALPKAKWDYQDARDSVKIKLKNDKRNFKQQYGLSNE